MKRTGNANSNQSKFSKLSHTNAAEEESANPYLSSNSSTLDIKPRALQRRFNFIRPGSIIKKAEENRSKEKLEQLKKTVAEAQMKASLQTSFLTDFVSSNIPNGCEWWDAPYLLKGNYVDGEYIVGVNLADALITNKMYILESLLAAAPSESPAPVILTTKELKKARRLKREAANREKQDLIRAGLLKPEEPKLKPSNYIKVLGSLAVQDPTLAEAKMLAQVEQRQEKHNNINQKRKAEAKELRAKALKKQLKQLDDELNNESHVIIFKIESSVPLFDDGKLKFKLSKNSEQLYLNGMIVRLFGSPNDSSMMLFEGSAKSLKKINHLIQNRIKWEEHSLPLPKLIWLGKTSKRSFPMPKKLVNYKAVEFVDSFKSEFELREYLKTINAENYYDTIYQEEKNKS